jgi:hypothetical protein
MKLFSNFDTRLDQEVYAKYISKFPKDKIILIYRDKIFFILFILLPLVFYILFIITLLLIWFWINLWDDILNMIKWWVIIMFLIWSLFSVWRWILKKLIDYHMDFCIVTPWEIVSYNQSWLFTRQTRSLDIDKLKTITVKKNSILWSIFNYWILIFLSEWDNHSGDIELYYIFNPDDVKNRIKDIIKITEVKWH